MQDESWDMWTRSWRISRCTITRMVRRMHDAAEVEGDLQMAMDGAHLVEQSARLAHGECDPSERGPLGEFRLKYLDFAIQDAESALGKYQHVVRTLQGDKKEAFEKKLGVIAADTMLARDKLRAARKRELTQLGVPRCE